MSNEYLPLLLGYMRIYRLLIMSGHVMDWASIWALGGPGPWSRSLGMTIAGLMGLAGNAMLSSCLVSLR